jgi:hypothetical protein
MTQETIYTGIRWFGHKVLLESSGDQVFDGALKKVFVKDFNKSGPLEISNSDVQLCLKAKELKCGNQPIEARQGQGALWNE